MREKNTHNKQTQFDGLYSLFNCSTVHCSYVGCLCMGSVCYRFGFSLFLFFCCYFRFCLKDFTRRNVWFVGIEKMKIYSQANRYIHNTQKSIEHLCGSEESNTLFILLFGFYLSVCCWLRLWLNASSMYYCASHEAQFTTSWIHSAAMTGCHCYWDGTISILKSYL